MTYPLITTGARTAATFRLRPTIPSEKSTQPIGLISANIMIVGASNRNIWPVLCPLRSQNTWINSSEKRAQTIVIGIVRAKHEGIALQKIAAQTGRVVLQTGERREKRRRRPRNSNSRLGC